MPVADDRAKAVELALSQIRSEEHTSELQSPCNLVCRLLLEKKHVQQHIRPEFGAVLAERFAQIDRGGEFALPPINDVNPAAGRSLPSSPGCSINLNGIAAAR